ncbi:MAG: response regulator [Anaerolineae bacterium]|nr:response regulator [Anaerolineae bacterium]
MDFSDTSHPEAQPLVLIADDEQDVAEVLERICVRAGFQVAVVGDGVAAIDAARTLTPDLLLLDIQMPYLDGWGVITRLREDETTRQLPIIVLTAQATKPQDAAHGIDLGADDYIVKPFNYHELLARMKAKIRARRLEESLQKRTQELEALLRLGYDLNRPVELRTLTANLLFYLATELRSGAALLCLVETADSPAFVLTYRAGDEQIHYADAAPVLLHLETAQSPMVLTAQSAQQVFQQALFIQAVAAPLSYNEAPIGYIAVAATEERNYNQHDVRFMSSISRQATLAIRNAQLHEELQGYASALEARVEARTAELTATQEQLIRSEKLASIGRLAREIAHEVNNPLQPIMVYLEDALEDLENGHSVTAEDLIVPLNEVKRLKRLVQRLQEFAKPDSGGMTQINLNNLISEVLTLTSRKLQKTNIELRSNLQQVPLVRANPDQIKQVLLNLTINAADAMENGGVLEVRLWHNSDYATFAVKDTGKGIPQENLRLIFEPFYTGKVDGAGIGLAVSHSIIEAHGGQIDVTSQVGVGTEFTVRLPLH